MVSTPEPRESLDPPSKRVKTSHYPPLDDLVSEFAPGALEAPSRLNLSYTQSEPFKHCVIDALFNPGLLQSVQREITEGLSFTEKETDIYKVRNNTIKVSENHVLRSISLQVHQTGDLASLSYLSSAQLSLFPALLRLRNALYSSTFRNFLREVTGCGPLSGTKQDMSVNSYKNGCHLLNHDDVIGTRRVSYILYMPFAGVVGQSWDPSWGGALELYPVISVDDALEPNVKPSKIIPPSWNQVSRTHFIILCVFYNFRSLYSSRYNPVTASIQWKKL